MHYSLLFLQTPDRKQIPQSTRLRSIVPKPPEMCANNLNNWAPVSDLWNVFGMSGGGIPSRGGDESRARGHQSPKVQNVDCVLLNTIK